MRRVGKGWRARDQMLNRSSGGSEVKRWKELSGGM